MNIFCKFSDWLGAMFGRMATMISEQGETVTRIDDNMDITLGHVNKGQSELLQYYNNMSGNRRFIVKLFAVILVLLVIMMFMR